MQKNKAERFGITAMGQAGKAWEGLRVGCSSYQLWRNLNV